jgi:hypothetical protein
METKMTTTGGIKSERTFLGKCASCKTVTFLEGEMTTQPLLPASQRPFGWRAPTTGSAPFVAYNRRNTTFRAEMWNGRWQIAYKCECGASECVTLWRVVARVTDKACNGTCMHATGFTCDCSCGGKNHGRGHAEQVEYLAA